MKSSNNQEISLSQQPFASADKVSQIIVDNIRGLKTKLPVLHRSMSLYLANPDTEYILLRPVKVSVRSVIFYIQILLYDPNLRKFFKNNITICTGLEHFSLGNIIVIICKI